MNNTWIEISQDWAAHCKTYESVKRICIADYLDLLGLYETCWFRYEFDDVDKKEYGYPNNDSLG